MKQEVGNHLSKSSDGKQQTGEEMYNLFKSYKKIISESKPTKPMDFEAVRNAVVSLEMKTSGGKKLATPLFDSALLNIPAKGANGQESHILTTLSFLILMTTQQGQWTAQVEASNPSSDSKKKTNKTEKDDKKETAIKDGNSETRKNSKTEPNRKASKTKTVEPTKPDASGVTPALGKGARPKAPQQHQPPNFNSGNFRPVHSPTDPAKQMNATYSNRQGNVPPRFPNIPRQDNFHVPAPVMMPSLASLHNKKAFFVLSVNGKQYGHVVIELRPE